MDQAWAQFGAVGLFVMAAGAAVKVLFAQQVEARKREIERGDRLEAELLKLHETVRTQYFSTIADATRVIGEALAVVRKAP